MIFLSVFSRLDPFPQVSRQLQEWPILELHEKITVPHIVACPIDFIFRIEIGREKCSNF